MEQVRDELVTDDDVRLSARRIAARGRARATVVVVHGFAATSDEARVAGLAEALHAADFEVLLYDSRGHGASGGETTLGDLEQLDVAAAVATVRDADVPVLIVGASMGAIGVLRFAADTTEALAGIVTVSCPSRWRLPRNARGIGAAVLTQTPVGRLLASRLMHVRISRGLFARPAPPVELVPRIRAPLALIHGLADPFIAPRDAEELYEAAHEPKRIEVVVGMGHAFEPPAVTPVLDALEWTLDRR